MQITRQPDIEKFVLDEMRRNIGKGVREGIHLSDTLSPRKCYWQKIDPLPATDDELMYWLTGQGHETAFLNVTGFEHGEAKEKNGIIYTPDVFTNFPSELKTRRKNISEAGKETIEYKHYLKQLERYCALENVPQGWLHVWCLVQRQEDHTTKPELASYRVEFTMGELATALEEMRIIKACIEEGLRQKNHNLIPQCPSWQCGKVSRTVKKLAHCENCKKDFTYPDRHLKSKPDHKIIPAEYDFRFEKRCKWFDKCDPKLTGS